MATNFGKILKNIWKLENIWYIIQSKILPRKATIAYKKIVCNDCWDLGYCKNCGCEIEEMFASDKPCPEGKFGSLTEARIIRSLIYIVLITVLWIYLLRV